MKKFKINLFIKDLNNCILPAVEVAMTLYALAEIQVLITELSTFTRVHIKFKPNASVLK